MFWDFYSRQQSGLTLRGNTWMLFNFLRLTSVNYQRNWSLERVCRLQSQFLLLLGIDCHKSSGLLKLAFTPVSPARDHYLPSSNCWLCADTKLFEWQVLKNSQTLDFKSLMPNSAATLQTVSGSEHSWLLTVWCQKLMVTTFCILPPHARAFFASWCCHS